MRSFIPAALAAAALFPAAAMAQDESCADAFAAIQKQIEGSALQADYEGREGAHPLVLVMADGELVDLSGMIIIAEPYGSWTRDRSVADRVGGFLTEAKPLIEAGDEEGCDALLEQARTQIASFEAEEEGADDAAADEPEAAEEQSGPAATSSAAAAEDAAAEEQAVEADETPAAEPVEEAGTAAAGSGTGSAEQPQEEESEEAETAN